MIDFCIEVDDVCELTIRFAPIFSICQASPWNDYPETSKLPDNFWKLRRLGLSSVASNRFSSVASTRFSKGAFGCRSDTLSLNQSQWGFPYSTAGVFPVLLL